MSSTQALYTEYIRNAGGITRYGRAVPRRLWIDELLCLVCDSPLSVLFRCASHLTGAKRLDIGKSLASGLGLGCVYVSMFSAYGLAFWFGHY